MACCEKCWAEARGRALIRGTSIADEYAKVIEERKDNPCSPEEQRGEEDEEARDG